jgi:hypothetical protein
MTYTEQRNAAGAAGVKQHPSAVFHEQIIESSVKPIVVSASHILTADGMKPDVFGQKRKAVQTGKRRETAGYPGRLLGEPQLRYHQE